MPNFYFLFMSKKYNFVRTNIIEISLSDRKNKFNIFSQLP